MEMCTPLTSTKGMHLNTKYCPDLEMEVTPCVKTYKNPRHKQSYPYSYCSSVSKKSIPRNKCSRNDATEIEYSVLEAEEMLQNSSLNNLPVQISRNLCQNTMPNYWICFQTALKGFDDPQLI